MELEGEGSKKLVFYSGEQKKERDLDLPSVMDVVMEPRSLCLIEVK